MIHGSWFVGSLTANPAIPIPHVFGQQRDRVTERVI